MKYFVTIVALLSVIACVSYLFCAYVVLKHMSAKWLKTFLTILLIDAAMSSGFAFCRIANWFKTPILASLILMSIASIAGIGMFLTFSGWFKNGKTKQ